MLMQRVRVSAPQIPESREDNKAFKERASVRLPPRTSLSQSR